MHQRRRISLSVLCYYFLVAISVILGGREHILGIFSEDEGHILKRVGDVLFHEVHHLGKGVHGAGFSVPGLLDADVHAVTAPRHSASSIPPTAAPLAKRQILMCTRRRRHLNSIFADCPCRFRTIVHQFKT